MSRPPLRLERSFFTRVRVEALEAHATEGTIAGSTPGEASRQEEVQTAVQLGLLSEAPNRWHVQLLIWTDTDQLPGQRYSVELRVSGVFVVDQIQASEDRTAQMVGTNGASILYSAAREYLLLLTSRGPWGAFTLPTASFLGMAFRRTDAQDREGGKESEPAAVAPGAGVE